MKSQQEFLNGVWNKVSELEYEEIQEQRAKQCNTQIKKKTAFIYLNIISIFIIFLFVNTDFIYCVCGLLILFGYYLESIFEYKINKAKGLEYGKSNYYKKSI